MCAMIFALALLSFVASGSAWADGPSDLIDGIYKQYLDRNVKFLSIEENPAILSKRLNKLFADHDANASADELGLLDFDPSSPPRTMRSRMLRSRRRRSAVTARPSSSGSQTSTP